MNQRIVGGPGQEGSYNVGVGDVGQLIALLGEVPDVLTKSFLGLLSVVFEIPWVPRTRVGALEVSHENLLQVRPTLNPVGRKVLQPCLGRIGQEQWEVADNEIVTICSTSMASKLIILEPQSGVCFPGVFRDVGRQSVPRWEDVVEDVSAKGLRSRLWSSPLS